jgi:hypothetical protein
VFYDEAWCRWKKQKQRKKLVGKGNQHIRVMRLRIPSKAFEGCEAAHCAHAK